MSLARAVSGIRPAYKGIRLKAQNLPEAESIARRFKLSAVASRVLAARGFRDDQNLKNYIDPSLREGLPDPQGLVNLNEGCELLSTMAAKGVGVGICCDFDVDGLSGGAQVHHFLMSAGIKSRVLVPDRFEDGYGLNEKMVRKVAAEGLGVLVTIDYGTTNIKELELARSLGLKTIVIDHHHVSDIDIPADVFINPQRPDCGFAGMVLSASGLAWYLLMGLKDTLKKKEKFDVKNYLDLTCLGTICDMVPLIGANRVIAKRGLELLGQTKRVGLQALKNVSGIRGTVGCYDVSFGIGPRLNAAGRMVHGEMVIELLTTEDTDRASKIAKKLNALNLERQDIENRIKEMALEQVRKRLEIPWGIVVWHPDFHTGVIGIVAQRLVETFYRPAVVLGADTDGIFKGSVRGIKGFNVIDALASVKKYLLKYGGHEGAGGLSIETKNLKLFEEAFSDECEKRLKKLETEPYVEADTEVQLSELNLDLVEELKKFAPFGVGNPGPVLLFKNLKVLDVKELKGLHLKATLTDGKRYISGLMWRHKSHPALFTGSRVNIACRPESSNYSGLTELQANLQAVEIC